MATAKQIAALAKKVMKNDSVIISGADYDENRMLTKIQVYFWDEKEPVMDIIEREDLVENWPESGVYAINIDGEENDALIPVKVYGGEHTIYFRTPQEDEDCDDLGNLPSVIILESLELICQIR